MGTIREHHQHVIERLTNELINDNRYLAMMIGGSIAKGWEQENSDVDIFLICTDEEFQAVRNSTNITTFAQTYAITQEDMSTVGWSIWIT